MPFDDRQCRQAEVDDLRPGLIQSYLKEVGSELHKDASKMPLVELGRQMNIVDGADEFVKPRNVGVLFFHDEPRKFLPGAQIDVVIFPKGPGGDELIEKTFHGPLHEQVRDAFGTSQNNVIREKVIKHPDRAEATGSSTTHFPAIEEAVVNAVYHRSYEQREPVEVRVSPDGIDVVSYPGPDASIRIEALNSDKIVARRYRNRRIGEFLKELDLTEGRCTGIPKIRAAMAKNGSPPPRFSTDEGRTYFLVELPVHPQLPGVQAQDGVQDGVQDGGQVNLSETEQRIPRLMSKESKKTAEIATELGYITRTRNVRTALSRLMEVGLLELTIPERPNSRNQKLRITEKGKAWLAQQSD